MRFFDVLNLGEKEIISLVGAGGKTSTMYAIGKEAHQKGSKVILTTTTKIFYPTANSSQTDSNLKVIVSDKPKELCYQVRHTLTENNLILVGKSVELGKDSNSPAKLLGLNEDLFNVLIDTKADLIIVEADGAARKPFKAPALHEPVIPESSTLVMPIVGIDCVNNSLCSEQAHRPEVVAEIAGVNIGDKITPEVIVSVFTSVLGYRKGLPPEVRWIPFINKVETSSALVSAREIAYKIMQKIPSSVLIGAAINEDPIKEVIEV